MILARIRDTIQFPPIFIPTGVLIEKTVAIIIQTINDLFVYSPVTVIVMVIIIPVKICHPDSVTEINSHLIRIQL